MLPTVGWALPYQLTIKKIPADMPVGQLDQFNPSICKRNSKSQIKGEKILLVKKIEPLAGVET